VLETTSVSASKSATSNHPAVDKVLNDQAAISTSRSRSKAPEVVPSVVEQETMPSGCLDETLVTGNVLPTRTQSRPQTSGLRVWGIAAACLVGIAGLILAAVIVVQLKTPAGTIVLEIDDPDAIGAVVTVDGKTITIDQKGQMPIEVTADEKEHLLKVTKGGFESFTQKFSLGAGGKKNIRVRLVPLAKQTLAGENFALEFDGKKSHVYFRGLEFNHSQPVTWDVYAKPYQFAEKLSNKSNLVVGTGRAGISMNELGDWMHTPSGGNVVSDKPAIQGQGVHLAGVWDGEEIRLFVNGKLQKQFYKPDREVLPSMVQMGSHHSRDRNTGEYVISEGSQFNGVIDEVRISNVARYTEDFTPAKRFEADEHTLALYHFDEGEGDVLKDSSGNDHHGTISDAKWVKVDDELKVIAGSSSTDRVAIGDADLAMEKSKKADDSATKTPLTADTYEKHSVNAKYALEFNGKSSHVDVPTLKFNPEKPITLEVIVRPTTNYPERSLADVIAGWAGRMLIGWSANDRYEVPKIMAGPPLAAVAGYGLNPAPVRPVHIAAIWTGNSLRFFVNGKDHYGSGEPFTEFPPASELASQRFLIGATTTASRSPEATDFFEGIIDEVRISNIARYTKDFTPAKRFERDNNTLALYHFDEGKGDVLKDSSGNGHHGTISGAKWVKVHKEL